MFLSPAFMHVESHGQYCGMGRPRRWNLMTALVWSRKLVLNWWEPSGRATK